MAFTPSCDAPCGAGGQVDGPLTTGALFGGEFTFTDATPAQHKPKLTITFAPVIPGTSGGFDGISHLNISVRCDDLLRGQLPGCVIADFIPTMTSMTRLPQIAANIGRIQQSGGYGVPGNPDKALHRETNPAQQGRNRYKACNIFITGPRPAGKSCDEYPFATTKEGGKTLPDGAHGWDWVPEDQQDSQGGLITGFHKQNRNLDGDPFYVQV